MRLGLIARCDQSGLGVQTWEYYRHLKPAKTLVIDVGHLATQTKHCNKTSHPERYPDADFHHGWHPPDPVIAQFLTGLDAVIGAETFYTNSIYRIAQRMRVRTILAPNWEFLDRRATPTLWAAPSRWNYKHYPQPKTLLPVPIATDRLTPRALPDTAQHILHIVGRPAVHDRNGTADLLAALRYVKTSLTVTVKTQDADYVRKLVADAWTPPHITLNIDTTFVENYWDNYTVGDLMVMPRRYGGLCLPVNEALGAGMPVIMPDIEPNNLWAPKEWLTPAEPAGSFLAKQHITYHTSDPIALAARIDLMATNPDAYGLAKAKALDIRTKLAWPTLLPSYHKALGCS